MKKFREKVWALLTKIPAGKVTTYREIARKLGKPNSSRAVGNACNANPKAPRVPCHRVVKSSGEVGGYAMGVKNKIERLESEGIRIRHGKVVEFRGLIFRFK
ncbi:Methylated-DNA--protein-cysteine methyltransferase [uncultured archaeon]|nr:Methylated-DNA--protein-cysteine methyltransferase [uncultured archaeon]